MTSFTRTWDASYIALPADSDAFSEGAQRIRNLRNDVQERIQVDHSMAGDSEDGEHLKISFYSQIADPTNAANKGFLYMKDVSSVVELFFMDESGNAVQLTSGGGLNVNIAANSIDGTHIAIGSDAQGDILYYDGTDYVVLTAGTSGQFLKTLGAGANPAWATVNNGVILTTEQTVDVTNRSTASTSFTSSSVVLTMAAALRDSNSKVLVRVSGVLGHSSTEGTGVLTLDRGGVELTPAGVNGMLDMILQGMSAEENIGVPFAFEYLDTPGTTGPHTYTLHWKTSAGTVYLGRRGLDTTIDSPTMITVQELAG